MPRKIFHRIRKVFAYTFYFCAPPQKRLHFPHSNLPAAEDQAVLVLNPEKKRVAL